MDCAELAEIIATEAQDTRQNKHVAIRCAAKNNDKAKELHDVEEIEGGDKEQQKNCNLLEERE